MCNVVVIWLALGLLASIFVIAALMMSSRISQQEDVEQPIEDHLTEVSVR